MKIAEHLSQNRVKGIRIPDEETEDRRFLSAGLFCRNKIAAPTKARITDRF